MSANKPGFGGHLPHPTCPMCNKLVYKMEEMPFSGSTYHTGCFVCGGLAQDGCNIVLKRGEFKVGDNNKPYCKNCYSRLFQIKGFGVAGLTPDTPIVLTTPATGLSALTQGKSAIETEKIVAQIAQSGNEVDDSEW